MGTTTSPDGISAFLGVKRTGRRVAEAGGELASSSVLSPASRISTSTVLPTDLFGLRVGVAGVGFCIAADAFGFEGELSGDDIVAIAALADFREPFLLL